MPLSLVDFSSKRNRHLMAIYNCASDLNTRETIWVSTNVRAGRPQLNSHREDRLGVSLSKGGIDGFPSWEIAGLYTNYTGPQDR